MAEGDNSLEKVISAVADEAAPDIKPGSGFVRILETRSKETETVVMRENREILDMRKIWSRWILFFIGVIIVFDIILVACYGLAWWDFKDPKVVMVVITENFLKIFGLGYLITHNIFKKIFI